MVIFSNNVKTGIVSFWNSLRDYPITKTRAFEKYMEMENALIRLDKSISFRLCRYRDLGQIFDNNGTIVNNSLYIFRYTDKKSKSQWYFSYIIDDITKDVFVYQMKYAPHVVSENNIQMSLKTSQLRQIIKEAVKRILRA